MFAQGFPHRGYLKINSTWVGIEPMSYSHNWFLTSLKGPMTSFIQYFILRLYIKSMSINRTFVRHKPAGGTSLPKTQGLHLVDDLFLCHCMKLYSHCMKLPLLV